MRKVSEFDDSASKYAFTERKGARTPIPESSFDKDYLLQRQYLEKLRTQRLKTEKLFEEYTNATRDLKRERQISCALRVQVEELTAKLAETDATRNQVRGLQVECEQLRGQARTLMIDKTTLLKKCKEQETQLTTFFSLRAEHEQWRRQIEEAEEQAEQAKAELRAARKQHQQEAKVLREQLKNAQKATQEAVRELKKEKEVQLALRTTSQQAKDRWEQIMMQKTAAFQALVQNYELELQIKDQTAAKTTVEMQESVKYWSSKFEQASRESRQLKKAGQQYREAVRRCKQQVESTRFRLQEKERKHESLQKALEQSSQSLRQKEEHLQRILSSLENTSGRVRSLEQENRLLREWVEEYEGALEHRRRREIEHKELLEDQLQQITRFQQIFSSIEP